MEKMLKELRKYLSKSGKQKRTLESYERNAKKYLEWLKKEGLELGEVTYAEGLKWVGYRQGSGLKSRTINHEILSINHLYESQKLESPIKDLRIRGVKHQLKKESICMEDLCSLYEMYDLGGLVGKRNKVILGILVYQGIKKSELEKLKLDDIDMERGLIRIPETGSTNSRILRLDSAQILGLNEYIYEVRRALNKDESESLFISKGSGKSLKNSLSFLTKQIHKNYGIKIALTQIREGVIRHWLETKQLREVQYMAGHRNASSTFEYSNRSLEDLKEEIDRMHPLSG